MRQLVIVESPHKAEAIEALYPGTACVATVGHICDLSPTPMNGVGVDRNTLQGEYVLTSNPNRSTDGVRFVSEIRRRLEEHPDILVTLATNPDPEGESTAAFLVKHLGLREYRRVLPHAITKDAFDRAWGRSDAINWAKVNEHEARRVINRLVGSIIDSFLGTSSDKQPSPFYPLQVAVEALIVERERAIRTFSAKPFYTTRYGFDGWQAQWEPSIPRPIVNGPTPNQFYDAEDLNPRCHSRASAEHAAGFPSLLVLNHFERIEEVPPPPPLNTPAMLRAAARQLSWGVGKTIQVAQQLFDGSRAGPGLITYHRGSGRSVGRSVAMTIRARLAEERLPVSDGPSYLSEQIGCGGIVPTRIELEQAGADSDQQALYRIIWERAMFSQLRAARFALKRVELVDPGRGQQKFSATSRTMIEAGWLGTAAKIYAWDTAYGNVPAHLGTGPTLPLLSVGPILRRQTCAVEECAAPAPLRYTVDSLISALDRHGLAHPFLLPGIFRRLECDGFVERDGLFHATEIAEKRYDALYPRFAFAHINYAIELEQALRLVLRQQLDGIQLTRKVWERLDSDCSA